MELNGMKVEDLKDYIASVESDISKADRDPVVTARWEGKSRARVEMDGRKSLYVGGDDEFTAMAGLLGMLAACDVEVISTHATLLGLEINDLHVEASGHFNVASLLGVPAQGDAAYQSIRYRVVLDAPNATQEQIDELRARVEKSSPVGDSLRKSIPLSLEFEHHG